jgi:hypothetical protein
MSSSWMYCRVVLVGTDISDRVFEVICSSETSVPTRTTRRHIPEDGISLSQSIDQKEELGRWLSDSRRAERSEGPRTGVE